MKGMTALAAAIGIACCSQAAMAQCDLPVNGGFEDESSQFPGFPEAWADIPLDYPQWVSDPVHTGSMAIELPPPNNSSGTFVAWTTDIADEGGTLYNPPYEYLGGTVTVSGWYRIDGTRGNPLKDNAGIKLELRRVPPNFSIYAAFEFLIDDATTDGEWEYFELQLTDAMVESAGDFPPYPGSMSILPFRFRGGAPLPTGTIYWDDICYAQSTCLIDFSDDGNVNTDDFVAFLGLFAAGDQRVDLAHSGNGTCGLGGDSQVNTDDFICFLTLFAQGCP